MHLMRQVLPELLDFLNPQDPDAIRSRAELRLVNTIMDNYDWVCRAIGPSCAKNQRVLELGAGDGDLAKHAWSHQVARPDQWTCVDLAPAPLDWPREATWLQHDVLALPVLPDAEVIVANLFLHQFDDQQLAALGQRLPATCRTFITCDPARHWVHSLQGRLLSVLARFNRVTRHDMHVSINAGFVGNELPTAMALHGWKFNVSSTFFGAYRLIASR